MRALRRKPARTPSVASSSMRSGTSGYRVKGAFLAGRRGSPSTPMPKWKVLSEARRGKHQEHHRESDNDHDRGHPQSRSQWPPISARKLAASLWELQGLRFSRNGAIRTQQQDMHSTHEVPLGMNDHASVHKFPNAQRFSPASNVRASMPGKQRRHAILSERTGIHGGLPKGEIGSTPRKLACGLEDLSSKLDSCGQITTDKFTKVLNDLWSLEERHACNTSLVAGLQAELDQAHSQLQELLLREKEHSKEVECVSKKMVEERALWKEQHEKSVRVALSSISQNLENERKAKQKFESLHKKVEKDLWETRRKLGKVSQDLEKERKARELMEDVCDELAREVGEDKARVEELKRESVKVREEVEEERKMLQMAEVWREERVQMKLMEAKLELEEKNTALDKLRGELETFLKAKRGNGAKEDTCLSQHTYLHSRDASSGQSFADMSQVHAQRGLVSCQKPVDSVKQSASRVCVDGHGSDDEDDLHSIELNTEAFQFDPDSAQKLGFVQKGRKPVNQRVSTAPVMQRQTSGRFLDKSQGFERLRERAAKECKGVGAQKEGLYDNMQVSQWIECCFEGGEIRDWKLEQEQPGKEECIKSWSRTNGRSHKLVCSSPKMAAMKGNNQSESFKARGPPRSGPVNDCDESIFARNQPDCWLQPAVYDFEKVHSTSMLDNGHEGSM